MLEPIEFRIVQHLQATLGAVRAAQGYYYDVDATAVKLDPNHGVDELMKPDGARPFVVIELRPDTWLFLPSNRVKLTVPMTIHWVSESVVTDDASRMQTYLRGCADVEKAIAADITRNGLAIDTRIVKRTPETMMDGAQVWAMLEITVLTARVYGQPT